MKITRKHVVDLSNILSGDFGWVIDDCPEGDPLMICSEKKCERGQKNLLEVDDFDNLEVKFCKFCGNLLEVKEDVEAAFRTDIYKALVKVFEK